MSRFINSDVKMTRRMFMRLVGAAVVLTAGFERLFSNGSVFAQATPSGLPLPDEPVAATLKRLFGQRSISSGEGKIRLDLPLIAEDGGNVAITIDTTLPVSGATHVSGIYIIATSVRLATTTDVRAVIEMNDGALYGVSRNVRVTISGCDLPPQG